MLAQTEFLEYLPFNKRTRSKNYSLTFQTESALIIPFFH